MYITVFLWFLLVAGQDYGRLNMVRLTFSSCRRESCKYVSIYNDNQVEHQREQFFIALHPYRDSPAGLRVNSWSLVEILDDDGMQSKMINLMVCVLCICLRGYNRPILSSAYFSSWCGRIFKYTVQCARD